MAAKQRKPGRNPLDGLSNRGGSYVDALGGTGRARRADATGRKKDYHHGTSVLTARVPEAVAEAAKAKADAAGLSLNAWLRALVEQSLAED
jgi:hypothetical protein